MTAILIAEDEDRIASFIEKGLRAQGYTTTVVADGDEALRMGRSGLFDLVLLDVGLPSIDGFTVLRGMREAGARTPVVILTARDGVEDTVRGLEHGADDYITKPFRFAELLARIRARLRDSGTVEPTVLEAAGAALDLRTRRVTVNGAQRGPHHARVRPRRGAVPAPRAGPVARAAAVDGLGVRPRPWIQRGRRVRRLPPQEAGVARHRDRPRRRLPPQHRGRLRVSRPPKRSWRTRPGHELVPGLRVVERLGGGRRTEVYRCMGGDHEEPVVVVVKVLRPGRTDERDVRMLRREAATLAALDHPGFPTLVDQRLEADPAWIAMRDVAGPHLSDLVRDRGTLGVDTALALAVEVADALAHLHARDRVHLDVKPSNVVLGTRAVLLDLGASRQVERAARLRPGVGTLSFLAPEQAAPGTVGVPAPASDVWGLGITLLRSVTGRNPLVARRADAPPPEPELVAACLDLAREVAPPLGDLLVTCLALDPAARPRAADIAAGAP